jgi:hypothetical protein
MAKKGVQVNFVVDCSGSMAAKFVEWKGTEYARYEVVKTALNICIANMQKPDRVSIVEFDSYANTLVASTNDYAGAMLSLSDEAALRPRGGTDTRAGLLEALKNATNSTKNITILFTDLTDSLHLSDVFNSSSTSRGSGDSCFKALADLGPVYVILIGGDAKEDCKNLSKIISKDYGIKWNDCYSVDSSSSSSQSAIDLTSFVRTAVGKK